MPSTFFFNGQTYISPTTVSDVNDTGFGPASLGDGDVVVMVGVSAGGQPNVPLAFSSPQQAQQTLVSGDLMTAVVKAFTPATGLPTTPSKVIAMRVGQATQSSLTLLSTSGGNLLTVTSNQYGSPAASTKIQIQNASGGVGFKVSVANGNQLNVQDNLFLNAFTIVYTGSQPTATIAISSASIRLFAPAGASSPTATFTFAQFPTIDQIVDQINGVPGFSATIGVGASGQPSGNIDYSATPTSCTGAGATVTANTQAVYNWLNSSACTLVNATFTGSANGQLGLIPWTFLSGQSSPAPLVADWANAFAALQAFDCQWIGTLSSNPAIWALGDAHCVYMSNIGRQERHQFTGPALGTTLAAAELLPLALNSDRTALCFPGYQDYDQNGNLVTHASYMTGGLIAACFASLNPGDAMTNKAVGVVGLELTLRDPLDTDGAIENGLLVLAPTPHGFKVVRSISTWQQNNNFNRVEISCSRAVDFVLRTVRDNIDQLRGGRQGPALLAFATDLTKGLLTKLAVPEPKGPGVLVGDANSPPFQGITASIQDDNLLVSFQCSPVIPNNFIGVTAILQAYSGTASV
jgi:hypothetical protein